MADANRDENRVPTIIATSSVDGVTPVIVYADPTTHGLAVDASVTITGAATEAEQQTQTAHLSQIETALETAGGLVVNLGANNDVTVTSGTITTVTNPVAVTGTFWQATQPVSGTVTANLSATDNAVLDTIDAVLDTINAKLVTGTDIGDVTINNSTGAAAVNIQDGGNTITVDGTVAVTNADITSVKTAVEVMDDWDDSNYCNVNMNVAGTDVAAGSGTISAQTLRVTIATDDPVNDAMVELAGAINTEMQCDIVGALPAGSNAIGKLAANSGVDIGDVDVTSISNGSLNGPGAPSVASYTHASINLNAGANQVLVSSAASRQIWVYGIGFTVNAAGTVSFQDEDDTAITGIMNIAASSGIAIPPSGNFAMPIWKLGTDKDLEVDVVTSELDGWIDYALVIV